MCAAQHLTMHRQCTLDRRSAPPASVFTSLPLKESPHDRPSAQDALTPPDSLQSRSEDFQLEAIVPAAAPIPLTMRGIPGVLRKWLEICRCVEVCRQCCHFATRQLTRPCKKFAETVKVQFLYTAHRRLYTELTEACASLPAGAGGVQYFYALLQTVRATTFEACRA